MTKYNIFSNTVLVHIYAEILKLKGLQALNHLHLWHSADALIQSEEQ